VVPYPGGRRSAIAGYDGVRYDVLPRSPAAGNAVQQKTFFMQTVSIRFDAAIIPAGAKSSVPWQRLPPLHGFSYKRILVNG